MLLDFRLAQTVLLLNLDKLLIIQLCIESETFSGEDIQIFVNVGELFEIIDIVFVRSDIEAQVLTCQLIQLFQIDIVAQVVSFKSYYVFLSVLIEFLKNSLELFGSLENVGVVRVDIIGFFCITFDS